MAGGVRETPLPAPVTTDRPYDTCWVCGTGEETGLMVGAAHPTCVDYVRLPPTNPGIRRRH
jgi:hypothetical protein